MQPKIDETRFGSITTAGKTLKHHVIIRLNGSVEKRGKKLSKDLCSTSHVIPAREVEEAYESGTKWMVLGAGQSGMAGLSAGAAALLESKVAW